MTQKIRVDVKTRKRYGQPKVLEETIRIAISDIETIEIEWDLNLKGPFIKNGSIEKEMIINKSKYTWKYIGMKLMTVVRILQNPTLSLLGSKKLI